MSATPNEGPPPQELDWRLALTEDERRLMLREIGAAALAAAGALWPQERWDDLDVACDPADAPAAPVERLGWIARLLPELAAAVAHITQDPHVALRPVSRFIAPPARARRVEPSAWTRALERGHAARWVEERAVCLSPDTAENRAVHGFLRALAADCAAMARIAEAGGEWEWSALAEAQAARLRGLLAHPLWQDMGAAAGRPIRDVPLMTRAPYARLKQWMREYHQGFALDWNSPLFQLPTRQTWQIYEAWCAFQTLDALNVLGFSPCAAGDKHPFLSRRAGRLSVRLARGNESGLRLRGPVGRSLRLWLNPVYDAGRRSRSRAMSPDMVLESEAGRLWLLDAKLKPYRAVGEEAGDMDQMHAYRDAILDGRGQRCVQRAWCLYAGEQGDGGRKQIAYGAVGDSVVGGLRLRPGQEEDKDALRGLLAQWLASEA